MRRGRTSVDRVLARSGAKSRALVEIVAAEHRSLGERLAMLVICDHENATATVAADLRGVQSAGAGSARLALASLLADPATGVLSPVLVTGRTVAAAPEVLERLRRRVDADLVVGPPDADGIAELTAAPGRGSGWTTRTWVRAVTDFFTDGESQVLVGTRALLGEGWDAPRASGLVDLSMASTAGAVVQTRGRTLRLDPRDPAKVAVNWTVCCVAEGHPRGDNDWRRTVAKHQGYFGVDDSGDVVDGVAHIHPSLSPHEPPPARDFDAVNAAMLVRAERRADITEAWRVGQPYEDEERLSVWLRPTAGGPPAATPTATPSTAPQRPDVVLTADGLRGRFPADWRRVPAALLVASVVWVALAQWSGHPLVGLLGLLGLLGAGLAAHRAAERHRVLLQQVARPPDPVRVAWALADGLHAAGLTERGAEAVEWHVASDGGLRFRLDSGAGGDSAVFAEAMADLVAPIGSPRYLVPRFVLRVPAGVDLLHPLGSVRPDGVVWHPVPTVLGTRADLAQAFAGAWSDWVGGGPAVFTGSPEGAGALAASRGTHPGAATSVLRLSWA